MRLGREDIDFLLRVLELSDDLRRKLQMAAAGQVELSLEDADQLRDLCGERLQTHGFGADYEVTEEGARLEKLIDELFIG
jgi:hypothetical protein